MSLMQVTLIFTLVSFSGFLEIWLVLKLLSGKQELHCQNSKMIFWAGYFREIQRCIRAWFLPSINFQLSSSSSLAFTLEELLLLKPPKTFFWQKSNGFIPFLHLWASQPLYWGWPVPFSMTSSLGLSPGTFCTLNYSFHDLLGSLTELFSSFSESLHLTTLLNQPWLPDQTLQRYLSSWHQSPS